MDKVKNYITILLQLIWIGVLELAVPLMTCLIKYVFQMKPKVLKLHAFNMITGTSKSRTLIKHISRKCECKYDGKKCQLHQNWTNDKSQCECKNL